MSRGHPSHHHVKGGVGVASLTVHVLEEVVEVRGAGCQYHFVGSEGAHLVFHTQPNVTAIRVVSKVTKSGTNVFF